MINCPICNKEIKKPLDADGFCACYGCEMAFDSTTACSYEYIPPRSHMARGFDKDTGKLEEAPTLKHSKGGMGFVSRKKYEEFLILRREPNRLTPEQEKKAQEILQASFDDFDWEDKK